ncbi:MAG: hypothetical protein FWH37_04995 [Candidatus Bathyarchaeota archaeon]|nr:hypothetical protein [Candidatus Termiticorpusculum sp.]
MSDVHFERTSVIVTVRLSGVNTFASFEGYLNVIAVLFFVIWIVFLY